MSATERTYEQIALDNPDRQWELHHGLLQEKPAMSFGHNRVLRKLGRLLYQQLDPAQFDVSINASRVHQPEEVYYIPDLAVIPVALTEAYRGRWDALEVYGDPLDPLPLVVEVWSPTTDAYDIDAKIPSYQARGDREIWRVHPFNRTLTAWRRQLNGSYAESVFRAGTVQSSALPGVTIDLDALFG